MAACPFRHFARFGLKLQPRQAGDVSGADLGQVYHRLLEKLFTQPSSAVAATWPIFPAMTAQAIHDAARRSPGPCAAR